MATPRVIVLRAPGTNCDEETAAAWSLAGALPETWHVGRLLEEPHALDLFQILTIPGGFSYGDDLGAGRPGHLRGPVGGPGVHHDQLVHQGDAVHQVLADRRHDRADGRLLVARGQHHTDPVVALGPQQSPRGPVLGRRGAVGRPGFHHR